jgi:hypothetical protein
MTKLDTPLLLTREQIENLRVAVIELRLAVHPHEMGKLCDMALSAIPASETNAAPQEVRSVSPTGSQISASAVAAPCIDDKSGQVKRYRPTVHATMIEDEQGGYVDHLDYRQLERDLDDAEWKATHRLEMFNQREQLIRDLQTAAMRPTAPSANRATKIHEHDCPTAWAFFNKHSLGSKLPPSCLVCGHVPADVEDIAIRHMELPNIVVCLTCRERARSDRGAA